MYVQGISGHYNLLLIAIEIPFLKTWNIKRPKKQDTNNTIILYHHRKNVLNVLIANLKTFLKNEKMQKKIQNAPTNIG